MATTTPNNGFILPGVNDPTDQDLWGGYLNENFENLDDLVGASEAVSIPIGSGMDYYGTTAPSGFVFAYGQALNRTTYALLFTAIGTTYGVGDGSTTFNLPDKRGRASFGKDNMGGTSADRLTGLSGGINGDTLGGTGGSETHTLTTSEMPSHTHSYQHGGPFGNAGTPGTYITDVDVGPTANNTATTESAGSGNAHNNLPPGIVCNYIIYTGVT